MAKGSQKGALLKRWELGLWAYQGLKQQWGDRKEAAGTCLDQHGFSSETEGSCTRVCKDRLLSVPNNPRLVQLQKKNRSSIIYPRVHVSISNTSCVAATTRGARPSRSCWRLCCLIWLREGRDWLAAAMVSFVQSSTSLWRSSVNVPLLLLLLLVWTWASRVIGWGGGEGVAVVRDGCVWLASVWAAAVLREDPEKPQRC